MPRAIISCLYRLDPSQLEPAPSAPLPMAVSELGRKAAKLIGAFRVGSSRTFDLAGLHHGLLEVLLGGVLSPAGAALVLHQALAPVPIRDRAALALFLTNSIRGDRLAQLAHGTLLTLRRAISLEESDVAQPALERIDAVLARRGSALFWHGGVLVVGDRVPAEKISTAVSKLGPASARHILVLVPDDEKTTSREVLLEHVRLQVACLDGARALQVHPPAQARRPFPFEALFRALARVFAEPVVAPALSFQVSGR